MRLIIRKIPVTCAFVKDRFAFVRQMRIIRRLKNMTIKKVCVIGAGISGLVAAKTFLEDGFDVTVFENKPDLGGVWEKSRAYPDVKTQNSRHTYCFTDYPMPEDYPEWPNGEQVRRYLQSYADNFGVSERISFKTEVIDISRKTGEKDVWVVSVKKDGF